MWLLKMKFLRYVTSLAVQWLRLCTSNAGDIGLVSGQATEIPHACQKQKTAKQPKPNPDRSTFPLPPVQTTFMSSLDACASLLPGLSAASLQPASNPTS